MAEIQIAAIERLLNQIESLRKLVVATPSLSGVFLADIEKRLETLKAKVEKPSGEIDVEVWNKLQPNDKAALQNDLADISNQLLFALEGEPVVDSKSIMFKTHASNRWVIALTAVAILGIVGDLSLIWRNWEAATRGRNTKEIGSEPIALTQGLQVIKAADKPISQAKKIPAGTPAALRETPLSAGSSETSSPTIVADGTVAAQSPATSQAAKQAEEKEAPAEKTGVTEPDVLLMIVLMGALGGLIHSAHSLANFVGNRQFLRSWIIYYLLIPVEGAALALILYLLLRIGVLSPAEADGATTHLNLIALYAFAGLAGLFSKQAIEALAAVFSTIFKKVEAKDSLHKEGPPVKAKGEDLGSSL